MSNGGQGQSWLCVGLVAIALVVGFSAGVLLLMALQPTASCPQCVPCPQASVVWGAGGPWGADACGEAKGERPAPEPSMGEIRGMSWGDFPEPNQIPDVAPGSPNVESWNQWIPTLLVYDGSGNGAASDLNPANAANDAQAHLIEQLITPKHSQTNNLGYYEHMINREEYDALGDPNPCFKVRIGPPLHPEQDHDPANPSGYSPPEPAWEDMTDERPNPSHTICPFAMHTYEYQYDFPSEAPAP